MTKICTLCKRVYEKESSRTYHLFPNGNDVERRNQWFAITHIEPRDAKYLYLCSDHFVSTDFYITPVGRKVLKKRAIPITARSTAQGAVFSADDDSTIASSKESSEPQRLRLEANVYEKEIILNTNKLNRRTITKSSPRTNAVYNCSTSSLKEISESASGVTENTYFTEVWVKSENQDESLLYESTECKDPLTENTNIQTHTIYNSSKIIDAKTDHSYCIETSELGEQILSLPLESTKCVSTPNDTNFIKSTTFVNSGNQADGLGVSADYGMPTTASHIEEATASSNFCNQNESLSTEPVKNEDIEETVVSTPKIKLFGTPRFIGDLTIVHMSTPKGATATLHFVKETINKKNHQIKMLRQKNKRCLKKIKSLEDQLIQLRSEISRGCDDGEHSPAKIQTERKKWIKTREV